MKKRMISLLLCAAMLLTLAPFALADGATEHSPEGEGITAEAVTDEGIYISSVGGGGICAANDEGGQTEDEEAPLSLAALDSSPEGGAMDALTEADADEPILGETYSGTCGAGVNWTLDGAVLAITGRGAMAYWSDIYYVPWLNYRSSIKTVVISSGVTSVGNFAFNNCNLTSITIPDSVTSIGWHAFSYSTGLTSVTIPDSVTSIGDYAFNACTGLTSVTIPDSVTSIGDYAFSGCTGLTSVTIPDSVTSIRDGAFSGCTGLTSVTIPDSVTSIGNSAFSGCTGLTSVTIPDSVTSIGSYAFYGCTGLTSVTIPDSVTSIGNYAFSGCVALETAVLGAAVKSIGDGAFSGCSSLTSISFPAGLQAVGKEAFLQCSALTELTLPDSVTAIGDSAFEYCTSLPSASLGSGLLSLGAAAFKGCDALAAVSIPGGVTAIGGSAFYGCTALTSVTIPGSVVSLGASVFYNCSGLTSVTIPASVKTVGAYLFRGCTGLTSVTLPESITAIGEYAFYKCSALQDVYFGGSQAQWNEITIASSGNTPLSEAAIHYVAGEHTHSWDSGVVTRKATCTAAGTRVYTCCGCGKTETAEIPALGHSLAYTAAKQADCCTAGNVDFWYCITCGKYFSDSAAQTEITYAATIAAPAFGAHTALTHVDAVAATGCTASGAGNTEYWYCDGCGNYYADAEAQTEIIEADTVLLLAHDWSAEKQIIKKPTQAETGLQAYVCARCGETKDIEVVPALSDTPVVDPDAPTVTVVGTTAHPGETVAVRLELTNNVGLAGLELKLTYDSALRLLGMEAGSTLSDLNFTPPGNLSANPVTLLWDGQDAATSNGTILTLFFRADDDAEDGLHAISVSYRYGGTYDQDMNDVAIAVISGAVTVRHYKPGDVNGDGEVSGKDITLIRRYLAGGYNVTIDEAIADVNGDGEANGKDITVLRRYFAGGYGVTLE